jgi:hypothetical protein
MSRLNAGKWSAMIAAKGLSGYCRLFALFAGIIRGTAVAMATTGIPTGARPRFIMKKLQNPQSTF